MKTSIKLAAAILLASSITFADDVTEVLNPLTLRLVIQKPIVFPKKDESVIKGNVSECYCGGANWNMKGAMQCPVDFDVGDTIFTQSYVAQAPNSLEYTVGWIKVFNQRPVNIEEHNAKDRWIMLVCKIPGPITKASRTACLEDIGKSGGYFKVLKGW